MVVPAPPGELLQIAYLKERLANLTPGTFQEIGPGKGTISRVLLGLGWKGSAYELGKESAQELRSRFAAEISKGQFSVICGDWLTAPIVPADLLISCMVMEHLDHRREAEFMRRALNTLSSGGRMIGLVPGSPKHWGIEDDIAGHQRRYTRDAIKELMVKTGWKADHIKGLTFPLSNLLLPISNRLVKNAEQQLLQYSPSERTVRSGHRSVLGKTRFPQIFGLLLNPVAILPFHWIQKLFGDAEGALVLYFEATPKEGYK